MILIIFTLGAIFNRIRGGCLTDLAIKYDWLSNIIFDLKLWDNKENEVKFVKDLNAIVYGITLTLGLNLPYYFVILNYLAMRLAFSFGWGGYIDGMISKKIDHNRKDVKILDKWFRSNRNPVASSFMALSLRGFMATTILALPFGLAYYLGLVSADYRYIPFVGLLMGSIYLLAMALCEDLTSRGNGWQWGEVVFGGYLWAIIYLIMQ